MPFANFSLVVLIGLVLGVIASVVLKSRGLVFFVNIILGVLGACIAALAPVIIGGDLAINVSNPGYLLRAVFGAFVLVLVACLFRPVKPRALL